MTTDKKDKHEKCDGSDGKAEGQDRKVDHGFKPRPKQENI